MSEPERILHILAPAPFGGLERVVQMLSRGQVARGHQVHLAAIIDAGAEKTHPFPGEAATEDVEVHPIPVPPRRYFLERRDVRDLCQRLQPTVIHLHGYRPDVLHRYLGRRFGVPVVTTVHGFTGGGWKNRLFEKLQIRSMRRMDGVVAVSPLLVEQLAALGIPRDRIHMAMNGLDEGESSLGRSEARDELGVAREGTRIGFIGRLSPEKGPDVLVEALGHLTDLPVALSLVGTGPLKDALMERAGDLGIQDRLHLHGRVDGAGRLMRAFDLVVLSSRTEGTPITLLEAMAAGVPVVATRVGGVPEVVSSDEAFLVPSESPGELAAVIRWVLDDPAGTAERVARARQKLLSTFSLDSWVKRYEEIYEAARGVVAPCS